MIIRFLELAIGREVGFGLLSFLWDDDSSYSFLAVVHSRDLQATFFSLFFFNGLIQWGKDEGNL